MKKVLIVFMLFIALFTGCGKTNTNIVKTYKKDGNNGIVFTYYEMNDGTWKCNDASFNYRLELTGRLPNAEADSCYVVLTDNEKLTFEDVSKSLFSSLLEDSKIMKDSVIVEMK